jgi:hypothetical protein
MADIKHVGRLRSNQKKVVVAFRTLPGESDSALVVLTENLTDEQHDSLIKLVESPAGQNSYEFGEVMSRTRFPDGTAMLAILHLNNKLNKIKTSDVEMIPNNITSVGLDQLNQLIAEQKGISVNDLALGNNVQIEEAATVTDLTPEKETQSVVQELAIIDEGPVSDAELAKRYRSQADKLSKEAAQLRRQADELMPIKKKISSVVNGEKAVAS